MTGRRRPAIPYLAVWGLVLGSPAYGQQVVDTVYRPSLERPAFPTGRGPRITFDASHNNPSTRGALLPLRRLVEADGYRTGSVPNGITREALARTDILVIVDALADRNVNNWTLPTPSAFDAATRAVIEGWVRSGGALLLAADHMPFAGAGSGLAEDLGLEALNGFAIDTVTWDPIVFRRSDGSLRDHPITNGRDASERIDSVGTYWGYAFRRLSEGGADLMVLPPGIVSFQPREAWRFTGGLKGVPVGGWLHAAAVVVGRGRVVILGDSSLLGAYFVGPARQRVGLNAQASGQVSQFVVNVFHWLSGLLNDNAS